MVIWFLNLILIPIGASCRKIIPASPPAIPIYRKSLPVSPEDRDEHPREERAPRKRNAHLRDPEQSGEHP